MRIRWAERWSEPGLLAAAVTVAMTLRFVALPHVSLDYLLYLGEPAVAQGLERSQQTEDVLIRQAIVHVGTVAPSHHQPCLAQHSQVGAGVLDRRRHMLGERFNGFLSLAEQVEQLDSLGARQGMADARELSVEGVFELSVAGHGPRCSWCLTAILTIHRINEYRHLSR